MPLVHVHMAKGRTDEQKRALLQGITRVMHETVGAPVESVRVWISEFEATEFIAGGEILADRRVRLAAEAAAAPAQQEWNEEGTS
ncbi:MAG: 2-hydroxymuconate tautomerase [Actinomycetota bacterium]|nr:2-hydroxymuconate tautomerase [Actinomycetota bacterium]